MTGIVNTGMITAAIMAKIKVAAMGMATETGMEMDMEKDTAMAIRIKF
jgi:hypothetical protein